MNRALRCRFGVFGLCAAAWVVLSGCERQSAADDTRKPIARAISGELTATDLAEFLEELVVFKGSA